jgi:hypothetical protein
VIILPPKRAPDGEEKKAAPGLVLKPDAGKQ